MVDLRDGTWVAYPNSDRVKNGDIEITGWYIRSTAENATFGVTESIDHKERTVMYRWALSAEELDERCKAAVDNGEAYLAELYNKEIEYRSNKDHEGLREVRDLILSELKKNGHFKRVENFTFLD